MIGFDLNVPITNSTFEALKPGLRAAFSEVQTAHRYEALARGLNFRTLAALQAAARKPEPMIGRADADVFVVYLEQHGFQADGKTFLKLLAGEVIRQIMEKEPLLCVNGFGVGQPLRNPDGSPQTPEQRRALLEEWRVDLRGQATEFLHAMAFLSLVPRTKTIRPGTGSYYLKHVAENHRATWLDGSRLGGRYIPNGVLIAAAIHMGFSFWGDPGSWSPNVLFNMSTKAVSELDAEVRPDSPRGQERRRREAERRLQTSYSGAAFEPDEVSF